MPVELCDPHSISPPFLPRQYSSRSRLPRIVWDALTFRTTSTRLSRSQRTGPTIFLGRRFAACHLVDFATTLVRESAGRDQTAALCTLISGDIHDDLWVYCFDEEQAQPRRPHERCAAKGTIKAPPSQLSAWLSRMRHPVAYELRKQERLAEDSWAHEEMQVHDQLATSFQMCSASQEGSNVTTGRPIAFALSRRLHDRRTKCDRTLTQGCDYWARYLQPQARMRFTKSRARLPKSRPGFPTLSDHSQNHVWSHDIDQNNPRRSQPWAASLCRSPWGCISLPDR
ncbi:hypothetical protein BKA63DRAFT_488421 [Paraphoma chrysanthemicola]|nr:hypothetical protein BKA63DRAFT_488421 [Paraphoma chrysanthemicola]